MILVKSINALLVGTILTLTSLSVSADVGNIKALQELADSNFRSDKNRSRNQYRHPAETLDFFGIKPDMHVLELWPVRGWYTEILGPYLKDSGQLTVANFRKVNGDADNKVEYWARLGVAFKRRLIKDESYFGPVIEIEMDPWLDIELGKANSQDMVVEFRNIHNWDAEGHLAKILAAVYDVLKPGGVFGVVEHRADSFSEISSNAAEGYLDENYVIEAAKAAGFVLDASSGINNNSRDIKNYPRGVYTLPPTLAMGAKDREKYLAIGESDRMTLRFKKPELTNADAN